MSIPKHLVGAYILTHLPTGTFYIGSSSCLRNRIYTHKTELKRRVHQNKKLSEVYTGWDEFSVELHITNDLAEAREKEQTLLNDRYGDPLCCNVSDDVKNTFKNAVDRKERALAACRGNTWRRGIKHTQEAIAKQIAAQTGKPHPLSDKGREAIRAAMRKRRGVPSGHRHSDEMLAHIAQQKWKRVSIDGTEYPSVKHAMELLSLTRSSIDKRLRSRHYPDYFFVGDRTVF